LRTSRLGRSADGIIVVPLLGIVLVLGVFAATAATGRSSEKAGFTFAPKGTSGDVSTGEVVTETIMRNGKTVQIVRYRKKPGRVVQETISANSVTLVGGSVTLPAETKTVVETHVKTRTVTNTVTETEPGTTVVVTVTEPEG
jgi:hypothetical protein